MRLFKKIFEVLLFRLAKQKSPGIRGFALVSGLVMAAFLSRHFHGFSPVPLRFPDDGEGVVAHDDSHLEVLLGVTRQDFSDGESDISHTSGTDHLRPHLIEYQPGLGVVAAKPIVIFAPEHFGLEYRMSLQSDEELEHFRPEPVLFTLHIDDAELLELLVRCDHFPWILFEQAFRAEQSSFELQSDHLALIEIPARRKIRRTTFKRVLKYYEYE